MHVARSDAEPRARARDVLVDPRAPPSRLRLALERPTAIDVRAPVLAGARLRDEEGRLALDLPGGGRDTSLGMRYVLPGRHVAELLGVDGSVRETREIVAGDDVLQLTFY